MRLFWLVVFLTTAFDQFSKYLAVQNNLAVFNQGISFGSNIFGGFEKVVIIVFLISLFLLLQKYTLKTKLSQVSWGLLFGAGLSNFIDRLFYGGVVDWMPWNIFGFTNNLADILIFFAVIGIIADEVRNAQTN